jgi:hypothetical protein
MADWPTYGATKSFLNVTDKGFEPEALPEGLQHRCQVLNEIFLDPRNGV